MRPELLISCSGEVPVGALTDVLLLVGVTVPLERIEPWTPLERALAYDWAIRVHLRASDNQVRERPKPSFVTAAERLPDA